MGYNFIRTTDEETKNKLIEQGFQQIETPESGTFLFYNSPQLTFSSDVQISKIHYTNILSV